MASLQPAFLAQLTFGASELSTIHRLGEARGRQDLFIRQIPQQLETLRTHAMVESAESSNRIEGVVASPGRVADLVVQGAEPRDRSEQEIAGYRDGLQLIHESHRDVPLSTNVVLQLHQMLYRYQPGWADAGRAWTTRSSSATPLARRFVSDSSRRQQWQRRRRWTIWSASISRQSPAGASIHLVLLPLAVLDFLCIHPFTDGNGRVARLLSLLLLYHFDYRVGRYISLERIVEESRDTYYESLERSSRGWHEDAHDVHPWLGYFWGVLLRAYGEFEQRVETLQGSKTDQVRAAVLRRLGAFGIADIEHDCPGVSRDMVRHVLRQMRTDGLVQVEGRGRGAKWRAVEAN